MKMSWAHIVPLSKQAIAVLKETEPVTGKSRYVFPNLRTNTRPMSENTVTGALRRLGYSGDEMTGHGFRSLASTRLNEMGWNRDAIERQLAHVEDSKVRAAYNHAEYLTERRQMMQAWADYLEALQAGADVVPLPRRFSRRPETMRNQARCWRDWTREARIRFMKPQLFSTVGQGSITWRVLSSSQDLDASGRWRLSKLHPHR
jgi:hypothetical protein